MMLPIVIDTREQNPLDFSDYPDVRIVRAKLWPGDYSLQAATRLMAIERKSVSDLIGTMMTGYAGWTATTPKRFDAELLGLSGIIHHGGRAFILVEPDDTWETRDMTAGGQIVGHFYRSGIPPEKILAFIESIRRYWGIPVILADSRAAAADIVVATARAANAEKQAWRPVDRLIKDSSAEPRQSNENGSRSASYGQDDKSIGYTIKTPEVAFSFVPRDATKTAINKV